MRAFLRCGKVLKAWNFSQPLLAAKVKSELIFYLQAFY